MMDTITNASGTETHRCACSRYSVLVNVREDESGDLVWDQELSTGCRASTTRVFAPGHDAKLKGLAIRAGILGEELRRDDGGIAVYGGPVEMTREYGFDHLVKEGIKRGAEKAAEKAAKKVRREARKATKVDGPHVLAKKAVAGHARPKKVRAKVGRWTYEGTVRDDGSFWYTAKNGEEKTAREYRYTVVPSAS